MRDHVKRPLPRGPARRTVGVRELKTHAAHILRQMREARASYLVTHHGRAIGVILPVDDEADDSPRSNEAEAATAWDTFLRVGRGLERRFAAGVSGVRVLTETRR